MAEPEETSLKILEVIQAGRLRTGHSLPGTTRNPIGSEKEKAMRIPQSSSDKKQGGR